MSVSLPVSSVLMFLVPVTFMLCVSPIYDRRIGRLSPYWSSTGCTKTWMPWQTCLMVWDSFSFFLRIFISKSVVQQLYNAHVLPVCCIIALLYWGLQQLRWWANQRRPLFLQIDAKTVSGILYLKYQITFFSKIAMEEVPFVKSIPFLQRLCRGQIPSFHETKK